MSDDNAEIDVPAGPSGVDDTPTIRCERCDREWDLRYELDDLGVGNQAVEQFALDHHRHTGHFPDGVSTWQADCRQCPEAIQRLGQRAARRWAETHARHTRHTVALAHADRDSILVDPSDPEGGGGDAGTGDASTDEPGTS